VLRSADGVIKFRPVLVRVDAGVGSPTEMLLLVRAPVTYPSYAHHTTAIMSHTSVLAVWASSRFYHRYSEYAYMQMTFAASVWQTPIRIPAAESPTINEMEWSLYASVESITFFQCFFFNEACLTATRTAGRRRRDLSGSGQQ
jgi:hypothetical protein